MSMTQRKNKPHKKEKAPSLKIMPLTEEQEEALDKIIDHLQDELGDELGISCYYLFECPKCGYEIEDMTSRAEFGMEHEEKCSECGTQMISKFVPNIDVSLAGLIQDILLDQHGQKVIIEQILLYMDSNWDDYVKTQDFIKKVKEIRKHLSIKET